MGKGNWYNKHRQQSGGASDLSSARGFPCVAGSCDTVREREAARELVTLVQDCLDALYPDLGLTEEEGAGENKEGGCETESQPRMVSIQDELVREISSVKTQSHRSAQRVVSLHTGIRGFVVVKIRLRAVCPARLVLSIFDRVRRERLPVARHLVKLLPLQHTFYPNLELMTEALDSFVRRLFVHDLAAADAASAAGTDAQEEEEEEDREGNLEMRSVKRRKCSEPASSSQGAEGGEEGVGGGGGQSGGQRSYTIIFNRRSHDVITRHVAISAVRRAMPATCVYNYREFKDVFLFEVFRNLAGVSFIEDVPSDVAAAEFNIRKFQLGLLGGAGGGGGAAVAAQGGKDGAGAAPHCDDGNAADDNCDTCGGTASEDVNVEAATSDTE